MAELPFFAGDSEFSRFTWLTNTKGVLQLNMRFSSASRLAWVLHLILLLALGVSTLVISAPEIDAQTLGHQREMGRSMLGVIKSDIKKNYYDPAFHGVELDAHFTEAEEKVKQATSLNEILSTVASAVMAFNDSHTYFIPPFRATRVEHGWQMQMIGDKCYIVAVQPGSDAEAKGLKPGDRILSVEGVTFARKDLSKLKYIFYILGPRTGMNLIVQSPDGKRRQLTVLAKVYEGKTVIDLQPGMANDRMNLTREYETLARLYAHRYFELGDEALVWKMPRFDLPDRQIDEMMDKAKKRKALLLDLRGNGGGYIDTLLRLVGHFFDRDVRVADIKRRSESKPMIAKSRGKSAFTGKVVILIDSESASAAEIFARVMQDEKRATVIGDRSAGHVMQAKTYEHQYGAGLIVEYRLVVTDADLINSDGKSLENVGVTPDELMLPKATDLASAQDPVLAHALRLVGIDVTPEKAGTMFPVEWRK